MTERPLPQPSVNEERERTIALLCEHFARDRLELSDFEARLDRANRATTAAELAQLLRDLPAAAATLAPPPATPLRHRAHTRLLVALMGGVQRSGAWAPGRRNFVFCMMGGGELDFRDVPLPPGETAVYIFCMMGGVEIIVPPGLSVDESGLAIMGGFGHRAPPPTLSPDEPLLRVQGVCFMGGAEVIIRLPGETAKEARERERAERRARKRLKE